MDPRGRTVEETLARIATAAHGVVTRAELLGAGVSTDEIARRVRKGLLLREHPGVYRVGHRAPSIEARYLAAVRACGERALLSGLAAGHLWGLLRTPPAMPEVTVPTERRVAGVRTRRRRRLDPRDATVYRGVPVTTVASTLVDLAPLLTDEGLARACHEAGVRFGTTPADVATVLARRSPPPGVGRLRGVLTGETPVTLSRLEREFLVVLGEAGLPLPRTNRAAGTKRVDCRWPDRRLTVELDSYRFHSSRHAWEQDRLREREARARGDEFRRYTYGDVVERHAFMVDELRALLAE